MGLQLLVITASILGTVAAQKSIEPDKHNVTLPVDWKEPLPDKRDPVAATKRSPVVGIVGASGYEFILCVVPTEDKIEFYPPGKPCGSKTDYGYIPTTLFAADQSYRYTMSRIGPFLQDVDKRVSALDNDKSDFHRTIAQRFDQLPVELIQSPAMKKFREDILKEVDQKLDNLRK